MRTPDFAKMVPGFDFLQGLMRDASAGMPNIGQWIAPTLDPAEIDKRIQELRTVQYWLEQNARVLGATIQALEVQRMTLATLQNMNMPMSDLSESLKIRPSTPAGAPAPSAETARAASPEPAAGREAAAATPGPAAGGVDPMQWWTALTRQFTELAANALKDNPAAAAAAKAGAARRESTAAASPPRAKRAAPAKRRSG